MNRFIINLRSITYAHNTDLLEISPRRVHTPIFATASTILGPIEDPLDRGEIVELQELQSETYMSPTAESPGESRTVIT